MAKQAKDTAPSKHTGVKIPAEIWVRLEVQVERQKKAKGRFSPSAAINWAVLDWLKAREAE